MIIRFRVTTAFVAAALVLGTLVACSGSDAGPQPTSEAGFCDALTSAYARCAGAGSCGTSMSADCTKLASVLSPSVLDGAKGCVQSMTCGSDPLSCLGKALGSATPSAAQTKLATDYCESCSLVGGDACKTAFFGTEQVPGLGFALLPFGDAPLAEIDSACTTSSLGKTACQAGFTACLSATTTKFLATTVSADSATCLIEGIKAGLTGADGDAGTGSDAAPPVTTCGPDNCAGCCDANGACSTADANSACGAGGAACTACTGSKVCDKGQCIDAACKASCTSGCCSAAGCQTGSAAGACGSGGNACAVCGGGQTCAGGACTLNGGALFDFVAVGARVPALNQSGGAWDAFSGLPDPLLKATSGAAAGTTTYRADTLTPVWNTIVLSGLTASALKADLVIELSDSDTAFDDLMGGCPVKLKDADFDGALHTVACAKSATGVALSVDYRLKAR